MGFYNNNLPRRLVNTNRARSEPESLIAPANKTFLRRESFPDWETQ